MSGKTTIEKTQVAQDAASAASPRLPSRIERRVWLSRALLVWERLWVGLWTTTALFGLFIASALFGVFDNLPLGLHWALIAAFALLIATALWNGLKGFRWPDRAAALAHLETASGLNHQPLSAYEDTAAQGTGDPVLWRAHQDWIASRLQKLKLGFVSAGLVSRDPYGLRAIVVLLLVIGIAGTGPGRFTRVAEAFFPGASNTRSFSIEAWITPPAYTGQRPIYLERSDAVASNDNGITLTKGETIKVPTGSTLSLRAHGLRAAPSLETASEDRGRPEPLSDLGNSNYMTDTKLTSSAEFALTLGGRLLRGWTIETIPDEKPRIDFSMPLQQSASGSLHFAYKVADDYGVKSAYARIALADTPLSPKPDTATTPKPTASSKFDNLESATRKALSDLFRTTRASATVTPPTIPLPLKSLRPKEGNGETYVDLMPHPWAGLPVLVTLVAVDDAGQEGLSAPLEMTLPARTFTKPLAAATIEQRRALAFQPTATTRIARVIDDLTRDANRYIEDQATYLNLRAAYWRLRSAKHDDNLTGIYDLLWSIALRIEDGDLSLAEGDMRRARDALAKALESGAGQDEISHLMDELRAAFQRYMDALTAKAGDNPDQAMMEKFAPQDGQTIEREALEQMLAQIDDLARNGSREDAQRLLEQMQAIMENMQTPDQNPGMSASEKAMAEGIDKLTEMMQQQRALMDQTFQAGPEGKGGQSGEGKENGPGTNPSGKHSKSLKALRAEQEALRGQLDALLQELGKAEVDLPGALGKAGDNMESAERRLGDGRTDRATQSQGQAMQNLREGTQGLVDELSKSMAGKNARPGSQGTSGNSKDPFGRSAQPNAGESKTVPDQFDRQKARAIIEDLRRRASEIGRPQSELDYLDRLLNRF